MDKRSDLCFILEGTWPYVAGGVSTWVQQLIELHPQYNISVGFIGANEESPRRFRYAVPPHVTELHAFWLHQAMPHPDKVRYTSSLAPDCWEAIGRVLDQSLEGKAFQIHDLLAIRAQIHDRQTIYDEIATSYAMWQLIIARYERYAERSTSFLDFYWTARFVMVPLLSLVIAEIPQARCYHSASTGYAGLLAAIAAKQYDAPYLLTEHGIYNRERRIEIFNAEWIAKDTQEQIGELPKQGTFKKWWAHLFDAMAKTAYENADHITTLFEANRQEQISTGAQAGRCTIIPNGIALDHENPIDWQARASNSPFRIGFVGRITAIKDIKNLLQACAILDAEGFDFVCDLLGPVDEEPDYVAECRELVGSLGLGGRISFQGRVRVAEWYPKMDVLVLTSISEGLPFVILEAQAIGVPVVSTDVGACRELLEGGQEQDRALGVSGLVVPVGNPRKTADALKQLAQDETYARTLAANGKQRVEAFYEINTVMRSYTDLYERMIEDWRRRRITQGAVNDQLRKTTQGTSLGSV